MKRFIQDKVALLFVPACLLLSGPAFGQAGECSTDDDCAEGQLCQKSSYIDGCTGGGTVDPAPAGDAEEGAPEGAPAEPADCNSEPQVSETGYCYTPPTQCESDADCGEYLSCVDGASSDCAVSSDGEMFCPEPAADAPKYCSVASVSCTADAECPREFECVDVQVCLLIACAEDNEDCPDPCAPSGEKQCQPKQIACEETADCPSAWSCVGNVIETCSGGATTPDDPGTDAGAGDGSEPATGEGSDPVAPDEVTCTSEPTVGSCQPDAWGGSGVYYGTDILEVGVDEDGSGASADPTAAPNGESADDTRAGGGCSVAQGNQPTDFAWVLSLLAALPLVRRRRSLA